MNVYGCLRFSAAFLILVSIPTNFFGQSGHSAKPTNNGVLIGGSEGEYSESKVPSNLFLVGIRVSLGKYGSRGEITVVGSLQPIFANALGKNRNVGSTLGEVGTQETTLEAPTGYAIGKLNLRAGTRVDAIKPTYYKIQSNSLDQSSSKEGIWFGGGGGVSREINGDGALIEKVVGRTNGTLTALGLVFSRSTKNDVQMAAKPVKPKPLQQKSVVPVTTPSSPPRSIGFGGDSKQNVDPEVNYTDASVVYPVSHKAGTVMYLSPGFGSGVRVSFLISNPEIIVDGKPITFAQMNFPAVGKIYLRSVFPGSIQKQITKMVLRRPRFQPLAADEIDMAWWQPPGSPRPQLGDHVDILGTDGNKHPGFFVNMNKTTVTWAPGTNKGRIRNPEVISTAKILGMNVFRDSPYLTLATFHVNPLSGKLESALQADAMRLGATNDEDLEFYIRTSAKYERNWETLSGLEKIWVFRVVEHVKREKERAGEKLREAVPLSILGVGALFVTVAPRGQLVAMEARGPNKINETARSKPSIPKSPARFDVTGEIASVPKGTRVYYAYSSITAGILPSSSVNTLDDKGTFHIEMLNPDHLTIIVNRREYFSARIEGKTNLGTLTPLR